MADIKTHLRELSVAVGVHGTTQHLELNPETLEPSLFFDLAVKAVSHPIDSARNILELAHFDQEYSKILKNGFNLGKYLCEKFDFSSTDKISWYGNDTQKDDPVDLKIGEHGFSLKEESFILENMGLYQFLSLMTTETFVRGLHVFQHFAPTEYEAWFAYTWKQLVNTGSWSQNYPKYNSSFLVADDTISFTHSTSGTTILPIALNGTAAYMKTTKSPIREKVVAKWISEELQHDPEYLRLKKICSETAGEVMCDFIVEHLSSENLKRLLQVCPNEYFYAKSTAHEVTVLRVPSEADFKTEIRVKSVKPSVPESQLNIITTLENTITGKTLSLRNECRFSHGQFNGTPESKMYYERGGDLSVIYTPV